MTSGISRGKAILWYSSPSPFVGLAPEVSTQEQRAYDVPESNGEYI